MADQAECVYDVFISYVQADRAWVEGYLLPAPGLPPERVITPKDFHPGAAGVIEFERAVIDNRYTVPVLSSAYLADEWSIFGEQLISHASVSEQRNHFAGLMPKLHKAHPDQNPHSDEHQVGKTETPYVCYG